MMKPRLILWLSILALPQNMVRAEIPLVSPEDLVSESSLVVVGTVRAVFSNTETSEDWEETRSVAEISVRTVEKGASIHIGDVIYVHYWNKHWIGDGDPPPHASGHLVVSKGEDVRAHLRWKNGRYNVLLPNGFTTVKPIKADETAPLASLQGTSLQGTWNFVYYREQGVSQDPGSRQFNIEGNRLKFLSAGATKVATTIETNGDALDQHFDDGQVYRSLFKRVGDLLIICGNRDKDRPTKFTAETEDGGQFLIVLERE